MQSIKRSEFFKAAPENQKDENEPLASADPAGKKRPGWRSLLAVVVFYSLLTILLTWPLILNFGTAVPLGDVEDRYQNFWNFWWVKQALTYFQNPYQTEVLYYPYYTGPGPFSAGDSLPLYFHTLQLLNCLLVLPLVVVGGVAAAYNGLIFGSFVASGVGAFLLARYLTKNIAAALLAGLVYAFSGIRFEAIHGSWTNILATQWLPFYILALHLWQTRQKPGYLLGAIACLAACAYTDWYNTTYLLLYTLFFFLVKSWPLKWWSQIKLLVPLALGTFLVTAPLVTPSVLELKNPLFVTVYGLDKDYRDSTLLSELASPLNPHGIALWLTLLVCAGVVIWRRQKMQWQPVLYWLIFGLTCFVLALGPKLQWERVRGSEPSGPYLPYYLFKKLPAAQVMHSPDRFEIPGSLGLGLALAFAVAALNLSSTPSFFKRKAGLNFRFFGREGGRLSAVALAIVTVILGGLVLAVVNETPLTLSPLERYAFVDTLLKDSSNYYLLELPITRHNNFDYTRMYNQIVHQRPITGGYISRPIYDPYREASSPFRYFSDQLYTYGEPDKEIFPASYAQNIPDLLIKLAHFDYIVVYKEAYKNQKEIGQIQATLEGRLGKDSLVQEDSRTLTYKTPAQFWQKQIGPGLILGEGWYGVEQNPTGRYRWSQPVADFYLTSEKTGPVKLKMSLSAFGGDQEARLSVEGRQIFKGRITPAPQLIEIEFEAKIGVNRLSLESLTPTGAPRDLGLGNDTRRLAFLVQNLTIQDWKG